MGRFADELASAPSSSFSWKGASATHITDPDLRARVRRHGLLLDHRRLRGRRGHLGVRGGVAIHHAVHLRSSARSSSTSRCHSSSPGSGGRGHIAALEPCLRPEPSLLLAEPALSEAALCSKPALSSEPARPKPALRPEPAHTPAEAGRTEPASERAEAAAHRSAHRAAREPAPAAAAGHGREAVFAHFEDVAVPVVPVELSCQLARRSLSVGRGEVWRAALAHTASCCPTRTTH